VKAKKTQKKRQFDSDLRSLLKEAGRQPGLAELMQVYESWRDFDEVFSHHRRLRFPRPQTTCTNTSMPVLSRTS
jgi:hypothetical protein